MLTIAPVTPDQFDSIVALWNAKRLDTDSCWHGADAIDAAYVPELQAAGIQVVLARVDGEPAGFGLWCAAGAAARLVALAADDPRVYYELMAAFCDWGLGQQRPRGFAELGATLTTERARMDALQVIQYVTIGFEPQPPDQPDAPQVPRLLRAECDLTVLHAAIQTLLEELA